MSLETHPFEGRKGVVSLTEGAGDDGMVEAAVSK